MKFNVEQENAPNRTQRPARRVVEATSPTAAAVDFVKEFADDENEDAVEDLHYIIVTPADDEAKALPCWRVDDGAPPFLRIEVYPLVEWEAIERAAPLPGSPPTTGAQRASGA